MNINLNSPQCVNSLTPVTFESVITLYQLDRTPNDESILNYEKISRIFIRDTGIRDIESISKDNLNDWKQCLINRVSNTSCNTYFRHIKALVKFAYDEGFIDTNPFLKFRFVPVYKTKYKCITSRDVKALILFINSQNCNLNPEWFWILVIKTFYYSGIRLRQLVGLRWNDIDFEKEIISLRAEYSKTKREWDIPIHPDLIEGLRLLKSKSRISTGSVNKNLRNTQVFNVTTFNKRYSGSEMSREQVSGFFQSLSEKSAIRVSSKRFRHQLATDLVNNNENIKTVQKLLGHANVSTTAGYIHTDINELKRTISSTTPL